jgi:D-glycero-alpha-D-manno-heptose-7-phosphate kinase
MIIVKAPFRISLFGGSTDYRDFYEKNGGFLIGTAIDKHVYLSMRKRPAILSPQSVITYSKLQHVNNWDEIQNPLIREILKYRQINIPIEFFSFSDIPARTGLGGSSSFCVGMLYLIGKVFGHPEMTKKGLATDAIFVERYLLKEAGGIQDQIWPAYGGLNTIEVKKNGEFLVKPLSVTPEFKEELEQSMILVYTNDQREQDSIAKSHENTDRTAILQIAKEAHTHFINENIEEIGKLLYETWKEKAQISPLISTSKISQITERIMEMGAYGVKLLGAGGCGFVLVVCNPKVKQEIISQYGDSVMHFKFEESGVSAIYNGSK